MSIYSDGVNSLIRVPQTSKLTHSIPATVHQTLQSGHGWSKQSVQGTQSDDTSIFYLGTQSLKLLTDGANSAIFSRKTGLTAIDLSGRSLKIWVRVSETTNLSEVIFYASSDAFSNFYSWTMGSYKTQFQPGKWTPITLSFGSASVTGSPNRSAITAFQFRVRDNGSGSISAWLGAVTSFAEPTAGICSIVFDDNWISQYTEAYKKMSLVGLPGCIYTMPNSVGKSGYTTLAQLQEMHFEGGWDIGGHWETNLTTYETGQVENIFKITRNYLYDNGFARSMDHFAFPNGGYSDEIINLSRRYWATCRTINDAEESLPPADPIKLRTLLIVDSTTTTAVANRVTRAINNKEWLIITFHKIVTSPISSTEYSIANFGTVIDNIITQGIKVRTVSDVSKNILNYAP